jgi:hypothetical protein
MNSRLRIISVVVFGALSAGAMGDSIEGGWTICTSDLMLRETLIESANDRELTLLNSYGIRSVLPMDQVLFVVKSDAPKVSSDTEIVGAPIPEASPIKVISLADGQTIRGSILDADRADSLAITMMSGLSVQGDAHIPLENLLRIQNPISPDRSMNEELGDDVVVLHNGDQLTGFVESVGSSVQLVLANDDELNIDLNRISRIDIANEPEPTDGIHVRFDDETVLRVIGFRYASQQSMSVGIDPVSLGLDDTGSTEWRFNANTFDALWVNDPAQSVVALAGMTPSRIEPMGDRAWTPTPSIIDSDASHPVLMGLDFHAPVRIRYTLPEGASRFACTFEAPIETWTDCIARVIVSTGPRERVLIEQRLHIDENQIRVNTDIPRSAQELIIEIDPGQHGPIQDRVLMHRPRLLVVD